MVKEDVKLASVDREQTWVQEAVEDLPQGRLEFVQPLLQNRELGRSGGIR